MPLDSGGQERGHVYPVQCMRLIEQMPREQRALRERLNDRLGLPFDFQAAQRLALGRVEEQVAQSGGTNWCMLIDRLGAAKDGGAMRLEPVGDTLVQGGGQALSDWAQWIHVVWHHSDHTPPPDSVRRLPAWGRDAKQHFLVKLAPGRQGRGF